MKVKLSQIIRKDQWFLLALLAVLIQQIIVALGTYLMGTITADVSHGEFSLFKIIALILSFLLSGSLIHYFVSNFTLRSQKSTLKKYLMSYFNNNYNNPAIWRNTKIKSLRHDIMSREGQDALTNTIHFFVDAAATTLNILFNTISIILVINFSMGFVLLAAGLAGIAIIHVFDKKIKMASSIEMAEQNNLNGFISTSWDNVVLGNQIFFQKWVSRWNRIFKTAEHAAIKRSQSNDFIISMASFVTTGMVVGFIFFQILNNKTNIALVTTLLVMLPRCMQIVMHLQIIQTYWTQWKQLQQKLAQTEKTILPLHSGEKPIIDHFIDLEKIKIRSNTEVIEKNNLIEWIENNRSGRITITGENGAGKSSLLIKIKEIFGEKSIYIPSHHHLEINDGESSKILSTGETLMRTLSVIKDCSSSTMYLLDEWDANLSRENRENIDQFLNQVSNQKLVVEVRHHG